MALTLVPASFVWFLLSTVQANCPTLVPGPNMKLTVTDAYVGDPPVPVSCEAGYKLEGDVLTKYLACAEISNADRWNDTVGECVLKACPNYTAPDHVESVSDVSGVVGDSILLTCEHGYASGVDPINRTVESTQNITCLDEPTTIVGTWETPVPCLELACFPPPLISKTVMTYTNVTNGSDVVYQCVSGYAIPTSPFRYGLTATCNSSAMWDSVEMTFDVEGLSPLCIEIPQYIGCVAGFDLVPETSITYPEGTSDVVRLCRQECVETYKTAAAIWNNTCICGGVRMNYSRDHVCDIQCPDFNATTMDSPVFCGGDLDLYSAYSTFDGCYSNIDVSSYPSENVTYGNTKLTCRERCRSQLFSHAGLLNVTCFCLNGTVMDAVKTTCITNTSPFIFDLAKHGGSAGSCESLYYLGVQMKGEYVLYNPTRTEYCNFADGTTCDDGWVGYEGHCYNFKPSIIRNFQEARNYCLSHDADLVSVLSRQELDFILDTMDILSEINEEPPDFVNNFWLGLVDSGVTSIYTWLDGNVMSYALFGVGQPKVASGMCANIPDDKADSSDCDEYRRIICKKPSDGLDCVTISSLPPSQLTVTDSDMTLTFCLELCKGQQSAVALVQNETCSCLAIMPAYTSESKASCLAQCPGNRYQYCGGDDELFTALNVSGRPSARSCMDLQLIGIGNGTFSIQTNTSTELQYCVYPECPYSWVSIDDHCYKFKPSTRSADEAFGRCAREDSYVVALETTDEADQFMSAVMNITLYRVVDDWRLGLSPQSMNGGVYRWSNGRRLDTDVWNSSLATSGQSGVVIDISSGKWLSTDQDQSFVCEKAASEYLGCFHGNGTVTESVHDDYFSMTIQQCVESCRASGYGYAFLNRTSCSCAHVSPDTEHRAPGLCTWECAGQSNQNCGGPDGLISVYNISSYEPLTSCEELFYAGVFLSQNYVVNGTVQHCDLLDGTVCEDGWVGYEQNCYKHYPKGSNSHFLTCKESNATMTSLVSPPEHEFLASYISQLNFGAAMSRVFTGVSNGGYGLDVYINPDGSLAHNGLVTNAVNMAADLHDNVGLVSFRLDPQLDLPEDGGVICKKEKGVIGCFEKPETLSPILENFASMTLTLCKQLCLANGSDVALIGRDFCACVNGNELWTMSTSSSPSCHVTCKLPSYQYCGDGTVVWAHYIDGSEETLAKNCSDLYRTAVFYNATYLLSDDNGTEFNQKCGFADNTSCPVTWLGISGDCFKFVVDHSSVSNEYCAAHDAYLVNPTALIYDFIIEFTEQTCLFQNNIWQTGLWNVMYDVTYIQSDGRLVVSNVPVDQNNKPTGIVKLKVPSGKWAYLDRLKSSRFICQKNEDYLGCFTLHNDPDDPGYSDVTTNSLTTCLQWCRGQQYDYAAVSEGTCQCLDNVMSLTSTPGQCMTACTNVPTQSCGGNHTYTVAKISNQTGMARTCRHLFTYGVLQPGWYIVSLNDTSLMRVRCFNNSLPVAAIPASAIVSPSVSSTLKGSSAGNLLYTFPLTTVWHPATSTVGDWVKVRFDTDHIITGIFLTGLFTSEESSHVTMYELKYEDPVTSSWQWYTQGGETNISAGCNDDTGVPLCYNYLWEPFVTRVVALYPIEWTHRISIQLEFMGQDYSQFDVTQPFIGCCLDDATAFTTEAASVGLDDCIFLCRGREMPFASLGNEGECGCGSGCPDNGFLDDDECPYNASTAQRTGRGVARAIYRTYDKHCEDPSPLTENRTVIVDFPYQPDVMTFGTAVHVTCGPGWEPVDPTEASITLYCQQSNIWTNISLACQEVFCSTFTVVNGTIDTQESQLPFNATLTVKCNDTHYASNGDVNMTVTCQQNHTWTTVPTCSRENARVVQEVYDFNPSVVVDDVIPVTRELPARSQTDCAVKCTTDFDCVGANYMQFAGEDGGTCRLYHGMATPRDLTSDPSWQYIAKRP